MNENRQTSLKPVRPIYRRNVKEDFKLTHYNVHFALRTLNLNLSFVRSFKPEKQLLKLKGSQHAFAVLENDSDENQLDISVTLSAG